MDSHEMASEVLTKVSKRLLAATTAVFLLTVILFALSLYQVWGRFYVSWFCFAVGVVGGFVSIEQRIKKVSEEELALLAHSWVHIILIPLFGGLFSLVLYLLLLSGIIQGELFPSFSIAPFADVATASDMQRFLTDTYPASGPDFAKLGFWSFVAGFSERFIPDLVTGVVRGSGDSH